MTYSVLPAMLQAAEQGTPGRIIQVASTAGLMGYPYVSAYTAAKHGVIGLTRALALELARQNITVNAVCPGYTDTAIVSQAIDNIVNKTGQSEEQARLALAQRNPMRRLVQPNEVADAVTWLCQPSSASINGQAIAIDGGEQAG
jgi:NAD(P)-dependent dehydrogenase (short-subunit alcohol dehydrogenase family)